MNTKTKGDMSAIIIMASLVKAGFSVSIPWGDCQKYDLIVDKNGKLYRIQCKTGWILDNNRIRFVSCSLTTKNGNNIYVSYTDKDVDFIMIYCYDNQKIYIMSIKDVAKTDNYLRLVPSKNNQKLKIKMAVDYEFNGIIPDV